MARGRTFDGSDGRWLTPEFTAKETKCPNCGGRFVTVRIWAFHQSDRCDAKYTCGECKKIWWTDGADWLESIGGTQWVEVDGGELGNTSTA